ncbi:MAG: L-rhamnose 1-epimerase [Subtercola sp.]|nr:L-rhamnose 1-epimerase [Subtercola sp.]
MTRRIAMTIGVREEKLDEYLRLHEVVWPDVTARLTEAGIRNYTIFRHGLTLFSYFEFDGDDLEGAFAFIAEDPVTQEWWKLTDACQVRVEGTPDGEQWLALDEVWHLD